VASLLEIMRIVDKADASFAARLEDNRFGIAMAEMMPMMATTMSSSISENPLFELWNLIVADSA
jgi:hypothetical protein